IVGTAKAEEVRIDPKEVEKMVPATISIMPTGIDEALGPDKLRDLMTFLLGTSPSMPNDRAGGPPPRSRAEVERALAGAPPADSDPRPMQVVLVAGAKDHGPGEHDYPAWLRAWKTLFEAANNVVVTTAMDWPEPEAFETADAIVFYQQGKWNEQRASDIDTFLKRGGGVSYIHYAVDGGTDAAGFAERIGLAWKGGGSKFRHGALDMLFKSNHPITRNINRLQLEDESYWQLVGDAESIDILGSGQDDDAMQPLVWCHEREAGRVFVSIPGHYSWTFDDPLFRILLLRGIAWTAHQPVDRFNELIYLGASVQEKSHGASSNRESAE
ncbi:MAG: ThuA domain-containing protein, partial [Planctomycetales bacterium]|nr:ThuA domain-containing protein [Planctomycetales bacterium]